MKIGGLAVLVLALGVIACGEEGERLLELTEQMAEELEQLEEETGGEPGSGGESLEDLEDGSDEESTLDVMPSGERYDVVVTGSASLEDSGDGTLIQAYEITYVEEYRTFADGSTYPEMATGSGSFENNCGDAVASSEGPIETEGSLLQTVPEGDSILFVYDPLPEFLYPDPCSSGDLAPDQIYSGNLAEAETSVPGYPTYYTNDELVVYGLTMASIPVAELEAGVVERQASWRVTWDEGYSSGTHQLVVAVRIEPGE